MPSLFSLLSLDPSAADSAVRSAYKRRAGELHPDRNPGFREQATRAFTELTQQYTEFSADPAAYRQQHAAPASSSQPSPGAGAPGDELQLEDAIELAGSLVELFAPAPRLEAARRAVASGARIARRYVRPSRG